MRAVVMNGGALWRISCVVSLAYRNRPGGQGGATPPPGGEVGPRQRSWLGVTAYQPPSLTFPRMRGVREIVAVPVRCGVGSGAHGAARQMTRKEIKLALKQMDERGAYSLRLFLDNRTTVLAHQWYLEGAEKTGDEGKTGEEDGEGEEEGLLRVVARGRQALIAVSRIVLIEMVPSP